MKQERILSLNQEQPYEVFTAGTRWSIQQKNTAGVTIWVSGLYFSTEEEARAHCADLEHLRTQIPGQLSLFDTNLNPTPEALGLDFNPEEASK